MVAAEAWGESLATRLRTLEGVGSLRIVVAKRYYSFKPPSWGVVALGVVLDESAEKRLKGALAAAPPPRPMHVEVIDAYGDAAWFKKLVESSKDE